ncbi:MAG: transposase [Rhabdochlamydiaceae bacterium]|nr:transposase [Candidatus Amphrikana amoebophyrae]
MIIRKTFKYRLKPNNAQRRLFAQFAGSCRFVYNRGLAQKIEVYEKSKTKLSYYDLNNQLPALKQEYPWLKDVHSQVLQQGLKDLATAFTNFFRRVKNKETPGFPKFKAKGQRDSFRFPQGVKLNENLVYLPKIGLVKFKKSRDILGEINQTTIKKEGKHWMVCFSCEYESSIPNYDLALSKSLGIDMGLATYATFVKGLGNEVEKIENPRFLKKGLKKLQYLSRDLSRKAKKSRNWYKARQKLQNFHGFLRNSRNDFAHKLSTQLVKSHDIICVESLSIKAMLGSGSKNLSRAISDAGWSGFLENLKYKASHAGKGFLQADRFYPSTKNCHNCGQRHELSLKERVLDCSCGNKIDRDVNAAINIKQQCLKAVGTTVIKLVELPH